jgi:hypothetical protein
VLDIIGDDYVMATKVQTRDMYGQPTVTMSLSAGRMLTAMETRLAHLEGSMELILLQNAEEKQLRAAVPGLTDTYNQYQLMLKMVQGHKYVD